MSAYTDLVESGQSGRQAMAERLVAGMQQQDSRANKVYWEICQEVIWKQDAQEVAADASLPSWQFTAENSALLVVSSVRRVAGFLNAIARAPQSTSAIDAGCGSSALLAIGVATLHPESEVVAYEVNGPAARCARAIVGLFGLSDRISVTEADVLEADVPEVDLAVTETFDLALLTELGHLITARLAQSAREILPRHVDILACDEQPSATTFWHRATTVDLCRSNATIQGRIPIQRPGLRQIHAYAAFYDQRGGPIVTEPGTNLTNPVMMGKIVIPQRDTWVNFQYRPGSHLHEEPAMLWAE